MNQGQLVSSITRRPTSRMKAIPRSAFYAKLQRCRADVRNVQGRISRLIDDARRVPELSRDVEGELSEVIRRLDEAQRAIDVAMRTFR